jgi:hypothetical protein
MLRFETESTLQMANYHGGIARKITAFQRLFISNLPFIGKHLLFLQWFSVKVRNYSRVFFFLKIRNIFIIFPQ